MSSLVKVVFHRQMLFLVCERFSKATVVYVNLPCGTSWAYACCDTDATYTDRE